MSYNPSTPYLDFFPQNETTKELNPDISDSVDVENMEPKSIWAYDHDFIINRSGTSSASFPILHLPNNIFVGTGGNAADSRAFMKKIRDITLSIYRQNDVMRSTHNLEGTSVTASLIAKAIADANHLPTQDANANRMLASSALVVGWDGLAKDSSSKAYSIWRCDPTGQFFRCKFGSVGRGAGNADNTILSHIAAWKVRGKKHIVTDLLFDGNHISEKDHNAATQSTLSTEDVTLYFDSMAFDDALFIACRAIRSAIGMKSDDKFRIQKTLNGIQGIFLTTTSSTNAEMLHPSVIREAFRCVENSL